MGRSKVFEFRNFTRDLEQEKGKDIERMGPEQERGKELKRLGPDPLAQNVVHLNEKKPKNIGSLYEPLLEEIEANCRTVREKEKEI